METNEQGLTKEEKIMFTLLGGILIIAIGVLIINSMSSNERKLEDNQTPITENKDQTDNVEDELTTNESDGNLIEDTPVQSDTIVSNSKPIVSNNSSTSAKPTDVVAKPTPEIPENNDDLDTEGEGSTQPSVTPTWDFKDTVITEAYANDEIIIEYNVILEDGSEAEAAVSLRKQEGNSYNLVDISEGKVIVTAGVYKYYYTYGNVTKELLLIVKKYLSHESINFLNLKAEYVPESSITESDYDFLKETIINSELTKEERVYNLTINKTSETPLTIPLVISFTNEFETTDISSKTIGVTVSLTNELWHQEITSKDIILKLDPSLMDLTNNQIIITIADIDYILNINVIENIITEEVPDETPSETPDETPSEDEDNKNDNEEKNDEENSEEINPDEKPEDETSEENPDKEEIDDETKPKPDSENNDNNSEEFSELIENSNNNEDKEENSTSPPLEAENLSDSGENEQIEVNNNIEVENSEQFQNESNENMN